MLQSLFPRMGWAALALACTLGTAWAQTLHVEDAWARATVPGQKSGSAFMTLHADQDLVVTGAQTDAADKAEIHNMEQDGDVMRMRQLRELPVPAHETVALTPKGKHIMLMNLHQPLAEGEHIALTLELRAADGSTQAQTVQVPVVGMTAHGKDGTPAAAHEHAGHDHEHGAHDH